MSNVFRILRTTVIKISLFFILLKKRKTVYRIYFVTRCISDPYFVLFYACDLRYFDVVLCPSSSRQILATQMRRCASKNASCVLPAQRRNAQWMCERTFTHVAAFCR